MTLIIETGEGVSGANTYAGLSYARHYLETRNNATDWLAASLTARQAALLEATTYFEITFGPRVKGIKQYTAMEIYARGFLTLEAIPTEADTITLGDKTYTFTATVDAANKVLIGGSIAASLLNLSYAINASGGSEGTEWGTGTTANTYATATISESGNVLIATAITSGTDGNTIAFTTTGSDIKLSASTLAGGTEPGAQPLEFPRSYLYDRSGLVVDGVPEKLKMAIVEYASRAISASLLPDPVYDVNGRLVTRETKQVGPIKTETRWTEGGDIIIDRSYPFADRLIKEYLAGTGGVYR